MLTILILGATTLFVLTLMVLLFSLPPQTRADDTLAEAPTRGPVASGQFFLAEGPGSGPQPGLPMELLLHRLEEHVRREHEAAEAFLRGPSAESLHAPSQTPLWN